ncbi:unnamed protein product [Rangifer tarandus platyrhynchus]|uniref:Peptidase C1A papain C-terminal domain-containing protein n=3 Tax=Rangifer tarandus platyrhynchus TaxID=3082113 RepID=A0ABN8Y8V8_RANTA|nr:unnamed protein product [Rangifer tarandus platyrhynchus]CAI9694998.1 unnamed protein product [Rangifer tarandus platyrhynchus]
MEDDYHTIMEASKCQDLQVRSLPDIRAQSSQDRGGVTVSAPRPAPDPPAGRSSEPKRKRGMELRRLWLLCCCCFCCWPPCAALTPPLGRHPLAAFRESLSRQRYLNSLFSHENSTAIYGINQFSYLFPEEFKAIYLRSSPSRFPRFPAEEYTSISNLSLPLRFDWRDKHVVTKVRNQKTCGGCWAFSVVGAVESVCAIRGQPLEALSVQQVIDCSYSNYGCNGGSPLSALYWLNKLQVKLVRDSEYPFQAQNGLCRYFPDSHSGSSIKGYSAYDFSGQEDKMAKALLALGPLIVVVDAMSWQDYLGGIIQHHCSSGESNHAVLVTGFDKTGSIPYWIVRNSWGTSWGIDGYVRVKMGGNICGIADSVSAVFV